jgi:hypothetical protein
MTMPAPHRQRLPNRRPSHTETLEVAGQAFTATVGFDPKTDRPCEVFLTAGKEGSLINAMLADAAVAISVALQHGVSAKALAKSIGRLPEIAGHPPISIKALLRCCRPRPSVRRSIS